MEKLLIASNNKHKVTEFKSILQSVNNLKIYSLPDFGLKMEIEEHGLTLEENALIKAKAVFDLLEIPVISDDTGLFVDSLNGEPGVFSARYAGNNSSYKDNYRKLLSKLNVKSGKNRKAYFETVICLYISKDKYHTFRGICKGSISDNPTGDFGFGYDPVFVPEGMKKTLAELTEHQKNKISHRALAIEQLKNFLKSNFTSLVPRRGFEPLRGDS